MADYREHYLEIRSAGASLVAVSVDAPDKSEALRGHLALPFPILCDTERRVVRDWGIYNSREKGGIAQPAVFIMTPARWYVTLRWTRLCGACQRPRLFPCYKMPLKRSRSDADFTSRCFPIG